MNVSETKHKIYYAYPNETGRFMTQPDSRSRAEMIIVGLNYLVFLTMRSLIRAFLPVRLRR